MKQIIKILKNIKEKHGTRKKSERKKNTVELMRQKNQELLQNNKEIE